MNNSARLILIDALSSNKFRSIGKDDYFYFWFHKWNFCLVVSETSSCHFISKLVFLNPPKKLDLIGIHCNKEDKIACMSINAKEELDIGTLLSRVEHWISNAWEIYNGEKTHDNGYRHGIAAFFEKICSDYGYIFCLETFDKLPENYKKEMFLMAIEHDSYKNYSYQLFLENLRAAIKNEENKTLVK